MNTNGTSRPGQIASGQMETFRQRTHVEAMHPAHTCTDGLTARGRAPAAAERTLYVTSTRVRPAVLAAPYCIACEAYKCHATPPRVRRA